MLVPRRLVLLVASLLLTLCDALTAAAPTGTVDREDTTVNVGRQRSTSCHPVRFDSILPTKLCAKPNEETDPPAVVFSWEGGNGRYSFFKVPKAASEVSSCISPPEPRVLVHRFRNLQRPISRPEAEGGPVLRGLPG